MWQIFFLVLLACHCSNVLMDTIISKARELNIPNPERIRNFDDPLGEYTVSNGYLPESNYSPQLHFYELTAFDKSWKITIYWNYRPAGNGVNAIKREWHVDMKSSDGSHSFSLED